MKPIFVKFVGIDYWNRPLFKSALGSYFGSLDKLFSEGTTKETVAETISERDLVYFGTDPDDDPMGNIMKEGAIIIDWN